MKFRLKSADEVQQRIVNRTVARSELSDLAPGDPLTQFSGAVANEIEDLYLDTSRLLESFSIDEAEGEDLDARAAEMVPNNRKRRGAARATGKLRWETQNPVAVEVPIPAGSVAAKAGNPRVLYVTTVAGRIPVGATQSERADGEPGDIPASAQEAGEAGNTDVDTVQIIVTAVPNAVTVTNPVPFARGVEQESDDEFREGIRAHLRSLPRCIPEALEERAKTAESGGRRVIAARAWEDPINRGNVVLYVDDGTGAIAETALAPAEPLVDPVAGAVGGEQEFYVRQWPVRGAVAFTYTPSGGVARVLVSGVDYVFLPSRGYLFLHPDVFPTGLDAGDLLSAGPYTHFSGLIRQAQRLIEGDPRDRATWPAWRAAGVVTTVAPPLLRQIEIRGFCVVRPDADRPTVVAEAKRRVSGYVNGLNIGAGWVHAEAIKRGQSTPGMHDFRITQPAGNVAAAFNQVIRATSGNINLT